MQIQRLQHRVYILNKLTLHSQARKGSRCFTLIPCASPVLSADVVVRPVLEDLANGFVNLVKIL